MFEWVLANSSSVALFFNVVGFFVIIIWSEKKRRYRQKLDVFRRLAGYRFLLVEGYSKEERKDALVVLNEVFVVYAKDDDVTKGLLLVSGRWNAENFSVLFKAMAKVLKIPMDQNFERFCMNPFNSNPEEDGRGNKIAGPGSETRADRT